MDTDSKKRAPRPPILPLLLVLLFGAGTFWVGGPKDKSKDQAPSAAPPPRADGAEAATDPGELGVPIAITIDDLPAPGRRSLPELRAMTEALLAELDRRGIEATGFVNSGKVEGDERDERMDILRLWLDAGHTLANHTARHLSPNDVSVDEYLADIELGEPLLDELTDGEWRQTPYYRHPFLQTGPDAESKARIDAWLAENGYRVAPVTHENLDWMFAAVYDDDLAAGDADGAQRVADAYVEYTDQLFAFLEEVSATLHGGTHAHVLLLHANPLNADHFDRVADVIEQRGYRYVTLDEALEDPIYGRDDTFAGKPGVVWQYRWAQTEGVDIDWKKEPTPPDWLREAYENR
ncbi:MAG: polysaccharide deacetylase family protein [Acidobacteriota bacterium]